MLLALSSCSFLKRIHTREEVCIDPVDSKKITLSNESDVQPIDIHKKPNTALQNKYSKILEVNPKQLPAQKLLEFIDEWYGVPYKYAGTTKNGIDCSHFAAELYRKVYGISISGSSGQLQQICSNIKRNELQEGDLLFFKIHRGRISHVGVYLVNDYFVHASTKAGVIISNLNEEYYKRYYSCAGRYK